MTSTDLGLPERRLPWLSRAGRGLVIAGVTAAVGALPLLAPVVDDEAANAAAEELGSPSMAPQMGAAVERSTRAYGWIFLVVSSLAVTVGVFLWARHRRPAAVTVSGVLATVAWTAAGLAAIAIIGTSAYSVWWALS